MRDQTIPISHVLGGLIVAVRGSGEAVVWFDDKKNFKKERVFARL